MAKKQLSGALKLTDLNDFISPSQACIKPVEIPKSEQQVSQIVTDIDGGYQVLQSGEKRKLEKAQISLADCLACSGCVTSAETVLISQQSLDEFMSVLNANEKRIVVTLSPQTIAAIAAHFRISLQQAAGKISSLLKEKGAVCVFDAASASAFSLIEVQKDFLKRLEGKSQAGMIPLLTSECPGWICYAEKTHGADVLPYITCVKSPMQIMGSLVKKYAISKFETSAERVYHLAIMPCYDKKLEASRDDFLDDILHTRDVDCVLTSGELLTFIQEHAADFVSSTEAPLDQIASCVGDLQMLYGWKGSSGGYLEYVLRATAKQLYGLDVHEIEYKQGRNSDVKVATIEVGGEVKLRFATAYGFRNIQTIIRKLKMGKSDYDFVEVMACPSGCLNGGGQITPTAPETNKDLLSRLESIFHERTLQHPEENPLIGPIYDWIGGSPGSDAAR
eukprot:TRINITY_DN3195_c0_g1_i4.p1 TRINITY_DN3195_c0_g1~~TRINITY_DN3195_c0_g1_i4.p1  ORF type:complete len:448 (+),score=86.61 TRINITY_DN3195_c0_g1_i4:49-1392(+)